LLIENRAIMPEQENIIEITEFPLISVIVPAYNAQQYIGETLQSIIHQSYPHLEIIVTDDGSDDGTADIVKKTMKKDRRVLLLQQPNSGVAAARNKAIMRSRGDFIAPVDADDICFPNKICKLLNNLKKAGTKAGLAYSWYVTINQQGKIIGAGERPEFEGEVFGNLFFSNFIGNASATLIRRDCFDKVGLYNTKYFSQKAQGCEDYDLNLRIAEYYQFKLIREFLTGYRKTGHSMSANHMVMDKSRRLVFKDQKIRNPWIPDIVFNWAYAYYYLWLSTLAVNSGCYFDAYTYLIKSAYHDPILIKNTDYLKSFLSPIKQRFKKILPYSFIFDNKKGCFQNVQQLINCKGNILLGDFEKIRCNNPKKSSIDFLKERRRMIACNLIRKAGIKNGQLSK
jgi:glycosyltransferase involved in cell wall biosynthesis